MKGGETLINLRLIGVAGMVLGAVATMISNYAQEQEMKRTVEEKVNEALAKRENETEEL